jgi:hypothetical protein
MNAIKRVAHRHAYLAFLCRFSLRVRDEKDRSAVRIWEDPRRNPLANEYLHATPLLPKSIRWRGQLEISDRPMTRWRKPVARRCARFALLRGFSSRRARSMISW